MSRDSFTMSLLSFLFFFSLFSSISQASVPPSATFKYVNEGETQMFYGEYKSFYRFVNNIYNHPFALCFYHLESNPNFYTLALFMGSEYSLYAWEANRGRPVREKATLTFGSDGNLVLADVDGKIAWQTNTANKGVTGLKLLPNGNLVLHDAKGKFIWQSFNYPTDTLLVGQSLNLKGVSKLVSRASSKQNINGPYSLVLEPKRIAMYYKGPNSPNPYLYNVLDSVDKGSFATMRFLIEPESNTVYNLNLDYHDLKGSKLGGTLIMTHTNYNSTSSILRLEQDGNLKIYTFFEHNPQGTWEETFSSFTSVKNNECQLPEKCGKFGLCQDSQCVACPSPSGLMGWSKTCEAKKVIKCGVNDFSYYKIQGADHFMCKYTSGDGPMKEAECWNKCTKDCKCLGYFYHQKTSRCWIAYDLKTLTKVTDSTNVAYIKVPKA